MEILAWLWWALFGIAQNLLALIWFLISGWVSTLLQIGVVIAIVYVMKYGWQRAPFEIARHTRRFGSFFWNWLRASEPSSETQVVERETIKVVRAKDFGDINVSTLMSLLMLAGLWVLGTV